MTENQQAEVTEPILQHVQAANFTELKPQGMVIRVADTDAGAEAAMTFYHDEIRIEGELLQPKDDNKYIARVVRVQDVSIIMPIDNLVSLVRQILDAVGRRSPATLEQIPLARNRRL